MLIRTRLYSRGVGTAQGKISKDQHQEKNHDDEADQKNNADSSA